MSFDNFISIAIGLVIFGVFLGVVIRHLWKKIEHSRLYYLVTPKLIKPYVGEKK